MEFPVHLMPTGWFLGAGLIYLGLLIRALMRAPWHYLRDSQDANVLLGSCVLLWAMWQFRAGISSYPGLEFHLLMLTTVTLMFGWAFALLVTSGAQLLLLLQGVAEWQGFALAVLCNGAVAIGTTVVIFRLTYRLLPHHFFVYIFVCSFFGAAASMLFSRLSGMGVLLLSGAYSFEQLQQGEFFTLLPLMMFPEAFLNGAAMTLLVVYKPHWVSSFRDSEYLKGK